MPPDKSCRLGDALTQLFDRAQSGALFDFVLCDTPASEPIRLVVREMFAQVNENYQRICMHLPGRYGSLARFSSSISVMMRAVTARRINMRCRLPTFRGFQISCSVASTSAD